MSAAVAQWNGQRARRAAKIFLTIGGFAAFAALVAREPVLLLIPLVAFTASCVLWVISNTARNEQVRIWDDFTNGRPIVRAPRGTTSALIALGFITPVATFLTLRIPMGGCVVLNIFGLPWPPSIQIPVQIVSLAIAVVGTAAIYVGMNVPRFRSVSLAVFWAWLILGAVGFFVYFLSVYGDPAPGSCR